jgi:hypothetical protein
MSPTAAEAGRHPRWPVQEPGTLPGRRPRQRRLNQLPDHTERELAFQLSTTRPQPAKTLILRGTVSSRQQRGLADPRQFLHDKRASTAQLGPPQALAHPLQFVTALKQHLATFTRARHHSHSVTLSLTSCQPAQRPLITAHGWRASLPGTSRALSARVICMRLSTQRASLAAAPIGRSRRL